VEPFLKRVILDNKKPIAVRGYSDGLFLFFMKPAVRSTRKRPLAGSAEPFSKRAILDNKKSIAVRGYSDGLFLLL
jgi:negative regulator of sigma E activity